MGRLMSRRADADVALKSTLDAEQEAPAVRVHRAVLMARAEVFRRMFQSGMQEQRQGRVRLGFAR